MTNSDVTDDSAATPATGEDSTPGKDRGECDDSARDEIQVLNPAAWPEAERSWRAAAHRSQVG
ncbi:MAG TPA: hypothetical protein VGM82_12880 [Gemmatimonadaceae bacterium]|jgi:hypothetical protein